MALNRIFVGDIGIKLRLYVNTDVTSGYNLYIKYKTPSGSTGTWSAVAENTYYCTYIVQSGDIDEAGEWELQAYITAVTGSNAVHGDKTKLYVYTPITIE
jgi:hypothetical protein